MPDAIVVQVPGEFAEDLVRVGFDELEPVRGGGGEAQAILAFAVTSISFAADVATIIVAKDALNDFISRLRSWLFRRTGEKEGSELIIEVTSRSSRVQSSIRLVSRRTTADAAPELDLRNIESLMQAILAPSEM